MLCKSILNFIANFLPNQKRDVCGWEGRCLRKSQVMQKQGTAGPRNPEECNTGIAQLNGSVDQVFHKRTSELQAILRTSQRAVDLHQQILPALHRLEFLNFPANFSLKPESFLKTNPRGSNQSCSTWVENVAPRISLPLFSPAHPLQGQVWVYLGRFLREALSKEMW